MISFPSAARAAPITLYTAGTSNGLKASVTLEELGIEYDMRHIKLGENEQKQDWFLKINPNGRIPAIGAGRLASTSLQSRFPQWTTAMETCLSSRVVPS